VAEVKGMVVRKQSLLEPGHAKGVDDARIAAAEKRSFERPPA
jgi:hypothetical protein